MGMKLYHYGFNLHIPNDISYLFMCLLVICTLEKHLFKSFCLFCLCVCEEKAERRLIDIFYSLAHSPNAHNRQSMARLKLGTGNPI